MSHTVEPFQPYRIKVSWKINPFYVRPFPVWKRALDIAGAVVGLVLLSPVLLAIGIFIRIISPGPVVFKQTRVGTGGQVFEFYKFRTMHPDVDTSAHQQYLAELIKSGGDGAKPMVKLSDEDRIIPFGQLLRKSCLDELPQLVNVLKGEMSLVGPRPPIPYEAAEYYRWHNGRFDCRPGMTGLWQVSGKNNLTFMDMVRLDIQYARRCSLWKDLKIIAMTPYAILTQLKQGLVAKQREVKGEEPCIS
jgi:lipopolysaccharide/colanic/teichoic acid biosynthesis glycosyltransferase